MGDGPQIFDQIKAAGFPHVFCNWGRGGAGYNEQGQPYGVDGDCFIAPDNMTADDYRAMVDCVIQKGLLPVFIVNGEGSNAEILATFQTLVDTLREGYDRTAYGPFLVSYDGVWPDAWSVDMMVSTIPWMRSVIGPTGYLGFMFGNGPSGVPYLDVINQNDYTQPWMDGLDIMVTTSGPPEAEGVSLANKAQYLVRDPNFSEFQPSFHGHFMLFDCSRGPRYWGVIEWNTYGTVRDPWQTLKPAIDAARARMQTMNIPIWG